MNEQLKFLIELQELDSFVLSKAERIDLIPLKLDKYKSPFQEAQELFQKARSKQDILNKKKKDKDLQLDEMQDKIDKLKSRSSDIKTNKEYEAHLKEIQGFEKNMTAIEDELLGIMEELENYEKGLKEEEMKVKAAEDDFKQQEQVLMEEQKKLQAELDLEKTKKDEYISRIDEELYTQYMNLMEKYGDKAVVETRNEICLGCNTNIPPQLYNDIKKNVDIYRCFYCTRILYYKESPLPEEQSQDPAAKS